MSGAKVRCFADIDQAVISVEDPVRGTGMLEGEKRERGRVVSLRVGRLDVLLVIRIRQYLNGNGMFHISPFGVTNVGKERKHSLAELLVPGRKSRLLNGDGHRIRSHAADGDYYRNGVAHRRGIWNFGIYLIKPNCAWRQSGKVDYGGHPSNGH